MSIRTIAVDLAKNRFELAILEDAEQPLPDLLRPVRYGMLCGIQEPDRRINDINPPLSAYQKRDRDAKRIVTNFRNRCRLSDQRAAPCAW